MVEHAGLSILAELEDPLPLAVHHFFATGRPARAVATLKWAVRTALHRFVPSLSRRLFTVHWTCLCEPAAG
jgi:hypothetical protein